jgi:hypothetical protein
MTFLDSLSSTLLDVLPIAAIVFGFQYLVIRRRIHHLARVLTGFLLVLVGLSLFLLGLDRVLFPLGELMARQLASDAFLPALQAGAGRHWSDYYWIYLFAFAMGAATTIAEPALIAVSIKAGQISGGAIEPFPLRVAVAVGVGTGIALGAWRIVMGYPIYWFIIAAYLLVIVQTVRAPRVMIPLAYDSGGVTTSTISVPIIAALGLGLAAVVPGRSALLDGFGMIALASLFPIVSVLAYAQLAAGRERRSAGRDGDRGSTSSEGGLP